MTLLTIVFAFIGLVLSFTFVDCHWHAYDERKMLKMRTNSSCTPTDNFDEFTQCPCFREATKPYPSDFIESLSLWPDLMSHTDVEHGETLYGSKWAIQKVYESQNPPDCRNAKYIISGGWPYGFGSRIHMEGVVMAMAMHLGRVYLPHPDGDNIFWETNNPFCKSQNDNTLSCFYERFSKCTIEDALEGTGGDVNHLRSYFMSDFRQSFEDERGLQQVKDMLSNHKSVNVILTYGGGAYDVQKYIPHQVYPALHCSPMVDKFYYYWWRAVSASYLIRPNARALRLMNLHHVHQMDYKQCIAMFVRHGDKGIDMKLLDFDVYRKAAVLMWELGMLPASSKYSPASQRDTYNITKADLVVSRMPFNGTMFITTEDPAVLEDAEKFGAANNWQIKYTNLFNRAEQTAYKTWDEQHKKGTRAVHDDLEYISMMLNLYYSLQCEGWVCTLASNSCRVMDELRTTIGGKANRYYADLSENSCDDPPCLGNHGKLKWVGERRRKI